MAIVGVGSILLDYHVHTTFSIDALSSVTECCVAATERGLAEICFTDHLDFSPADPGSGRLDPERYLEAVSRASGAHRLTVLLGAEVGVDRASHPACLAFMKKHPLPFDFLLGSVHVVEGHLIDLPFLATRTREAAYRAYFEELEAAVRVAASERLFDAVGHFDLIKRYAPTGFGPFRLDDCRDQAETILRLAADGGVGLEINTSGLRGPLGETLPALEILRRFRELGGEVLTIGSDSHRAKSVGAGVSEALDLAREAGFGAITSFRGRHPIWVSI
ncbi:MAG: histidinol-phosphatase HisJ family protein [bacterium]|nr:histidinol-phosphatase HisJ family protein [bacterium]